MSLKTWNEKCFRGEKFVKKLEPGTISENEEADAIFGIEKKIRHKLIEFCLYCFQERLKFINNITNMTDKQKLEDMFLEMSCEDLNSRKAFSDKNQFDFDYSIKNEQVVQEIVTSNNTRNEKLCPTGTK